MSCKVKSFYVVRSALLLCLSLQIFAGSLPGVFTIYTRRPSFLFNRAYAAVIWVVTKERCVGELKTLTPSPRTTLWTTPRTTLRTTPRTTPRTTLRTTPTDYPK